MAGADAVLLLKRSAATPFFVHNLPSAGFPLGRGEAEARFGDSGVIGF
jgi:hypothetical protein